MTPDEARRRREDIGLSQNAIAQALEVHPPFGGVRSDRLHKETISRWERGFYPIPPWYESVLDYIEDNGLGHRQKLVIDYTPVITTRNVELEEFKL